MRTTLDLDVDVLQAAKELAAARGLSAGQMVSELLRKALTKPRTTKVRNGVPIIVRAPGAPPLTMQAVNGLRDE